MGEPYVMLTHFAAAIRAGILRNPITSLKAEEYAIGAALDVLIGGY